MLSLVTLLRFYGKANCKKAVGGLNVSPRAHRWPERFKTPFPFDILHLSYAADGLVPFQLRQLLDIFDRSRSRLILKDNPWVEPPESIVVKGHEAIRGYYENLYAERCRVRRNSVKVVLVGQEGAGKTKWASVLLLANFDAPNAGGGDISV